jgi:hypothetical protein
MDMDYNLLPLTTFILKMTHTIYYTQNSIIHLHSLQTLLVAFLLYVLAVPTLLLIFRSIAAIHKLANE